MYRLVADGELPLPEHTDYPLAEAATAIRVMSAAEHTGKLVLSVPRTGHSSVVVPPDRARPFRRDGAYIITGGLGGLGLFLAAEMAAAGCGRIVLTGRSKPTPKAEQTIARIRATGADIEVVCGNIAERDTAGKLVDAATATGLPLRGVLHAAAVVEDATLTNITDELIDRDWAPKVYGAWHLHHATAAQPLDWFCSFSSAAALLGSPGQGAYAAANSWLDAFTQWRRAQGLPATAIAWGAWAADRTRRVPRRRRHQDDRPAGGCARLPDAAALRPHLQRLRSDRRNAVADRACRPQPVRRGVQDRGEAQRHDTATVRAELRSLPPDEWPTRLGRLVAEAGRASSCAARSIPTDRSPTTAWTRWATSNCAPASKPRPAYGSRRRPSPTHNTVRALARHLSDTLSTEETAATAS